MGILKKHDAIQNKSAALMTKMKEEREYTHNNQPPPVCLFCGRREIREKNCSGWQTAAPNRTSG